MMNDELNVAPNCCAHARAWTISAIIAGFKHVYIEIGTGWLYGPRLLQDIARFVRNARTHLLEKDAAALAAVLGAAPTAASTAVGAGAIFLTFMRPRIIHLRVQTKHTGGWWGLG